MLQTLENYGRSVAASLRPRARRHAVTPAFGLVVAAILPTLTGKKVRASASLLTYATVLLAHSQRTRQAVDDLSSEMRHLWSLSGVMTSGTPWPSVGGWALSAEAILATVQEFKRRNLRTVVELGPGSSTILFGRCLPDVEMWGVEHDSRYAEQLNLQLRDYGMSNYNLIEAPLEPVLFAGEAATWYAQDAIACLPDRIDLLVIDGPPNWGSGANNRAPAWQALGDRLLQGSLILVDDTWRPSERQMVRTWTESQEMSVLVDAGAFILLEVN